MAAYLLASLFFACALLTKTVTATLPAALLVVFWWQRGGISWRRDVLPLVPWFALAATSGLFTSQVEKTIIGANGAGFDLTLVQRCLLAGRVIWFYLGKVLLPTHLVFFYPRWDVGSAAPGWTGFLVAAAAVTVALFLLRGRSRGPLAAWLFFVGSLFPALGFFNVYPFIYSYVADHFQYLACLGPVTLLSAGVAALLSRSSPAIRGVGWGLAAVLVATLGLMSNAQSRTYADPLALYTTTLARNPDCWMAHNNLGLLYDDQGASDKAIAEYEETLRLKPDLPRTHDNLGHAFARMPGRLNDAVAHYEEALRLKPDFAEAHNDLANVLAGLPGRLDEAIGHFGEAVRLEPDSAEIHNNLGNALAKAPGRLNGAVAEFEEALRLKPDFAGAHNSLGGVLGRMPGRLDEAIAHFQEALRLEPGFAEAHNNLGTAFLSVPGRLDDAVSQFKEALRLRPDFAEAHNNLGNALSKKPGRTDEAIAEYGEALRLRPDYGIARNNLGTALYAQGRAAEAVVQYQEALRLMPDYAEIRYNIAMALLSIPGRANEAAGQLEAFLQARPGNETARRMLAQIRANQP
jgi:tetratricopeptide (TPR) repeat protein